MLDNWSLNHMGYSILKEKGIDGIVTKLNVSLANQTCLYGM